MALGDNMAGGKRIDDHSFWAGGKSKGSVFPEGAKIKHEHSAEGAGAVMEYEDTTEEIHRFQNMADKKVHSHARHPGYRY